MKHKISFLLIFIALTLAACSDASESGKKVKLAEMPADAVKNGCSSCHAIDHPAFGPAWLEVSKFYNGLTEKTSTGKTLMEATGGVSAEVFLINKVSQGGMGNWGAVPMMAKDKSGQNRAEIKHLVEFVLNLAKKPK